MANKTYDRNSNLDRNEDFDNNNKNMKNDQFDEVLGKNMNDAQAMKALREKYGDEELAKQAFQAYKDRKHLIGKKANKFKALIFSKYGNLALPNLIEKAKKYKKKYGFSDEEFQAFFNMAVNDKSFSQTNMYNQANTPMSRLLGYGGNGVECNVMGGKMNVPTNELDVLQEILRLQAETCVLHEQVKLQSLTYVDCAPQALTGVYDKNKQNSFSYIHPVIAALFFPRIKYIDEHMLLASIANIVSSKYHGLPIKTQPEYELYWDLITDPNDNVCASIIKDSPLLDLRNRVKLQIELWKNVRELREGRYYSEESRLFNLALDNCSNGLFDAPDMCNLRDEGTVLRKLFGAFSLRPTIVSIASLTSGLMGGNYNLSPMALSQVTTIPIVNLRLPFNFKNRPVSVYLNEALEQPDWFVENKMIVPKVKSIIYSRDIIVFYANRRFQAMNYSKLVAPYNFTVLPPTHSSLETINDVTINFDNSMVVGDERFILRSVVLVERSLTNKDLIVGSSAAIVVPRDFAIGRTSNTYLLYNPQAAIVTFDDNQRNGPIVELPATTPFNTGLNTPESFMQRASTRGTIFIYCKVQSPLAIRPCF